MSQPRQYFPALDGLRALAVISVFAFHLIPCLKTLSASEERIPLLQLLQFGWMGVDLFFALSGFLITTGLLHLRSSESIGRYFRLFYHKRVLRIFPLYYAVCLILLVLWPMLQPEVVQQYPDLHRERWSFFLHVQNWLAASTTYDRQFLSHIWSLCVEEQFYLVWPVCVLLIPANRRGMLWCIGLAAVVVVIRMAVLQFWPDDAQSRRFIYYATCCRCDTLLMGAALAYARLYCPISYHDIRTLTRWKWPMLAIAVGYLGWMFLNRDSEQTIEIPALAGVGFSVVACGAAVVVWVLSLPKADRSVVAWSPLRYLGRISYGFYVFQTPVLFFLFRWFYDSGYVGSWWPWVYTLMAFVVTLALSVISYHFFESIFLRMKPK